MQIVASKVCCQTRHWQIQLGSQPYLIDYTAAFGYNCECMGFTHRRKCKHVEEAKTLRCHWGEANEGVGLTDLVCPKCGSPTVDIKTEV